MTHQTVAAAAAAVVRLNPASVAALSCSRGDRLGAEPDCEVRVAGLSGMIGVVVLSPPLVCGPLVELQWLI
jgi:hypothetical protein